MPADLPSPDRPLRLGTRGSPLALAQAKEVRARLMAAHGLPEAAFEIVVIRTTGDRVQDRPLAALGGKGLFTREIEEALARREIDAAVHSMKDMPTLQPAGLVIGCLLPREDVRDAFVSPRFAGLAELPAGEIVGTSSLRRAAQLRNARPDLQVVEFRGNVQTRLGKLADGVAAATFLAMAGLNRLGRSDVPAVPIPVDEMLPAVGQGAIGVESRADDDMVSELLSAIHDAETGLRLAAERAFLAGLDGSCQTPIAGLAEIEGGRLRLRGEILRPDGSERLAHASEGATGDGDALGAEAAAVLRGRAGPNFFG
ncbi:hydroxymethylbilane synthase [Amaricoccus macauensis]|uniref:Porphobilinogen deaminase n=1 Tax=Amaricoccus macauensis TaxID=57001 RepID=A0A840SMH3_9RHOB|nr:hydroxymethylbilane synthase [Amaricoccus macauensis]MBB5220541.1 hydroxymethylbilane synthase [Amaricoccus macauensis]